MKIICSMLILLALTACANSPETARVPPPVAHGQVHGFPAEWLNEPEKHGLPAQKQDKASDRTQDPGSR